MHQIFAKLVATLVAIVGHLGYPGIVALMFLESSFFPFPSEVVIPPAAYLAQQGKMSLVLVITCGIAGSILGALFNYWLALRLGRPAVLRFGRRFGLTAEKYEQSEEFLRRHGIFGTFIGRLIPVIRQYISFPAGLARMPLLPFITATGLGAGIWVAILAAIGWLVGDNRELIARYSHRAFYILLPLLLLAGLIYIRRQRQARIDSQKSRREQV
jgi:membrane protein DedA with SNARE-associated domain